MSAWKRSEGMSRKGVQEKEMPDAVHLWNSLLARVMDAFEGRFRFEHGPYNGEDRFFCKIQAQHASPIDVPQEFRAKAVFLACSSNSA